MPLRKKKSYVRCQVRSCKEKYFAHPGSFLLRLTFPLAKHPMLDGRNWQQRWQPVSILPAAPEKALASLGPQISKDSFRSGIDLVEFSRSPSRSCTVGSSPGTGQHFQTRCASCRGHCPCRLTSAERCGAGDQPVCRPPRRQYSAGRSPLSVPNLVPDFHRIVGSHT